MLDVLRSALRRLRGGRAPLAAPEPESHFSLESLEGRLLMSGDPILLWNQIAYDAALADSRAAAPSQPGPTYTSRAIAIVHAAMFDAYNGITNEFESYLSNRRAPGASIDAAVAQAAHDTLVALYPQQKAALDAELKEVLDEVPNGSAEKKGVQHGQQVAKFILNKRKKDHARDSMDYIPGTNPGDHQVDPMNPGQPYLTPLWGKVTPFTVESATQFAPPAFPELSSAEYAADYNDLIVRGALDAETSDRNNDGLPDRTDEQTEIGIYWGYDHRLGTPPRLYNEAARVIAGLEGNTVGENARLFTLISLAMADAGITAWHTKWMTDRDIWRPVMGIRYGDVDGNPDTVGDPNWIPLGAPANFGDPAGFAGNAGPDADPDPIGGPDFTPPFPAYISGHATFGAAAFKMLANFYGTDEYNFSLFSEDSGTTRTFDSFSEASEENGISRIYLGIHWNLDNVHGQHSGNEIADYAFENYMRPMKHPKGKGVAHILATAALPNKAAPLFADLPKFDHSGSPDLNPNGNGKGKGAGKNK